MTDAAASASVHHTLLDNNTQIFNASLPEHAGCVDVRAAGFCRIPHTYMHTHMHTYMHTHMHAGRAAVQSIRLHQGIDVRPS